jgi:2',3'-cyclic-nucleotide 2'-phosphodiesterase/3'-nucleotidase
LPRLRRAGADVIIGLSHSGIGTLKETPGAENATRALASMWGFGSGFDALIGGHTHQLYPIPAGDTLSGQAMIAGDSGLTPLVMPGFFGSHLGVIDLELCHDGQRWRVGQHRTELRPVAQRSPDGGCLVSLVATAPQIAEIARPDHAAMVGLLAKPVGRSLVPLHSYFALIGETPIQQLLGAAQKDHIGRLLQDTPFAGLPLISAVAPFKAGGRGGPDNFTDLPAGELTERSISDLYIHPNTAVALCLTGADLMQWLERAVSLFHQIAPGTQDAPLIDPAFPAFNFDIFQGVSFQIDLTQPARFDAQGVEIRADAQRIRAVRLNGLPLAKDARVVVATNSYRASGGAGFAGADCRHVILESGQPIRQVLQSYIRENKFVRPAHTADWHFKPCPRTSVTFDSAPEAARHMLNPALAVIGLQTSGFMRFRLLL